MNYINKTYNFLMENRGNYLWYIINKRVNNIVTVYSRYGYAMVDIDKYKEGLTTGLINYYGSNPNSPDKKPGQKEDESQQNTADAINHNTNDQLITQ